MNIPKTTFNYCIERYEEGSEEYELRKRWQEEDKADEAKRHRLLKRINKLEEKLLEIFFYRNSLIAYVIYLFSRETNETEETYYDRTGN